MCPLEIALDMEYFHRALLLVQIVACLLSYSLPLHASSKTHYHDFVVANTNYTRLCSTKEILTVNGQFPGPTLYVNRGDRLVVTVYNQAPYPVTIHWHGLLNPGNSWSDGPEYITQCGIQSGANFTHDLHFSTEEGTIWYHAHSEWTRLTVHGAVVVYPKTGATYPHPNPYKEYVVVFSEWWKVDVMTMYQEKVTTGADFNKSDAYTINGQPGDLYACSKAGVWLLHCHFDRHYTWGMSMVFIVKDGPTAETSMLPPPPHMPPCTDSELADKTGPNESPDQRKPWVQ